MYKRITDIVLTHSICLIGLIGSFNLFAAESSTLDEVIVTASRYSQTADESLTSTTVITRADIEQSSALDLPGLLSRVAGFDLRSSGAYGKATSAFVRGTNSDHLLTLIDGVKIYSATLGTTAFQHIPLDQIERIEIVRGPRSSVYGAEAIGGVIQIFTRKGKKQPTATANVGLGSNNSKEVSASFGGATENARFSLNARGFKTDGIDALVHTAPNDNDGYTNDSINARFDYKFNQTLSLQSSFMNAQGNTQFDNCFNPDPALTFPDNISDDCSSDFVQQTFSNTLNITPDGIWDGQLQLGTSRDFSENFWESITNGTFETRRDDASFINNLQFSENQLLALGIDYSNDTVDSTSFLSNAPSSRDNTGLFAAWNASFNKLNIELNARTDDNEQFNRHNTGSVALGFKISKNMNTFISYGSAFKTPTFNQLYFPGFGSPALKPEESDSLEVGLRGKYPTGNWSLNIYQTNIDNLIAGVGAFPNTIATNINKSQITGTELTSSNRISKWRIDTSLSYTDPVNKSGPDSGKQLQGRAKETLSLSANRNFGSYNLGISLLAQSKRYQNADNTNSTAGYGLVDLTGEYHFNSQFKLALKLNNIFDKNYAVNQFFTGNNYSTLGRNFFVNLIYNM
ncbi:Outer membrane vitamin B12 receptor BtuB [hydrothermal vent metagenome]|uniref:Outer membrane vitamin B12 receptor BtuB n=1 Tax=hydrothermal vent metagenome TaxID=652676 RepID=A0A3B0X3B6_9ZZZZ